MESTPNFSLMNEWNRAHRDGPLLSGWVRWLSKAMFSSNHWNIKLFFFSAQQKRKDFMAGINRIIQRHGLSKVVEATDRGSDLKNMIVKSTNLTQGPWYKCSKGTSSILIWLDRGIDSYPTLRLCECFLNKLISIFDFSPVLCRLKRSWYVNWLPRSRKTVVVKIMAHRSVISIQMALYLTTSFLFPTYVQQVMFTALLRALERQAPSSVQNVWQNQDGLHSQHQRYYIVNNYLLK